MPGEKERRKQTKEELKALEEECEHLDQGGGCLLSHEACHHDDQKECSEYHKKW